MRAAALIGALFFASGCSVFFDPNDHVGPGGDGGPSRDGGRVDGGVTDAGPRPDRPAPDGQVWCTPNTVGMGRPTCELADRPGGWTSINEMPAVVIATSDLSPGADVDVDVDPSPTIRALHLVGNASVRPALANCTVDGASGMVSCDPSMAGDISGLVSAHWAALTHDGETEFVVVGDATGGGGGVWLGVTPPPPGSFAVTASLGGVTVPPWGEVAFGGRSGANRRTYIPEPPNAPLGEGAAACTRQYASVGALPVDEGASPAAATAYRSLESEAICNTPSPCTPADGIHLDAATDGMMAVTSNESDVLIWDGDAGQPARVMTDGRGGRPFAFVSVEGGYVLAYATALGFRLASLQCARMEDTIGCCVQGVYINEFGSGARASGDRFALAPAGGTSVVLAYVLGGDLGLVLFDTLGLEFSQVDFVMTPVNPMADVRDIEIDVDTTSGLGAVVVSTGPGFDSAVELAAFRLAP